MRVLPDRLCWALVPSSGFARLCVYLWLSGDRRRRVVLGVDGAQPCIIIVMEPDVALAVRDVDCAAGGTVYARRTHCTRNAQSTMMMMMQ